MRFPVLARTKYTGILAFRTEFLWFHNTAFSRGNLDASDIGILLPEVTIAEIPEAYLENQLLESLPVEDAMADKLWEFDQDCGKKRS